MARTVVRPRRKQRPSSGSSSARSLLGNALVEHRLPLAGVGLVLLAAALVNWVTGQINILISGERVKGYPIASFPDYDPLPLFGKKALDWVWSRNTGKRLEFTPDDAAEIDDARKRLVKWMVDEKVTGTGRLKKDDELNDQRRNIPSGFLRSGVHVEPLSDSIDEDILLPGNFGRPLKGYRYVQINRAELVAAKRAEKKQPDRSSGGYSEQALRSWYEKWVAENLKAGKIPSREDDWKAAKNAESKNVPRDAVRALRNELAPETWTKQGRRKGT